MSLADAQHCAVVNLSALPESRLLYPRVSRHELAAPSVHQHLLMQQRHMLDAAGVASALQAEQDLGYMVASGRYWEHTDQFDKTKLSAIDHLWLQVMREPISAEPLTQL
jgi:hypothetical protein